MHRSNTRVRNSYIPWTSQHSCTCFWFVFHFFLSLFIRSQNSALLRDFLRLSGWNLHRNHPGHAAHPEQLQAHLAGQSRTSRWESRFLFVMVPASTPVRRSLKVMLSWKNFQNEQTLLRKRRKGGGVGGGWASECSTNCGTVENKQHLWAGFAIFDHLWPRGASLTNPRPLLHQIHR